MLFNGTPPDPDSSVIMVHARGSWGNKAQFLLTCFGNAASIGTVWRFPYLCYRNGGATFLIPYLIMMLVIGLPLMFMEMALGQFASEGPITVWKVSEWLW
ncbi:sodium- and chloride-dependent glycine transporter 1-like [Haliotis rubra]|uniref:sodium- and chloride-dependent glycine transporter 1-like n=1 Tax=Haliotis rubra TaxID=36100 RepID=UPI001EE60707|nr:sodium- and chloride-dependent glycine transporter 1-like [Haliotis rubra]